MESGNTLLARHGLKHSRHRRHSDFRPLADWPLREDTQLHAPPIALRRRLTCFLVACLSRGAARSAHLLAACEILLVLSGCQRPAASVAPAAPEPAVTREYWDALFVDSTKVGFSHTRYESLPGEDGPLVQITAESKLSMRRFGQSAVQKMSFTSVEKPDGTLLSCSSKSISESSASAPVEMKMQGRVTGEQLELQVSTPGKVETAKLRWDPSWRGFFGMEQTLENDPMEPGESRRIHCLMAGFNQVADVEFRAIGYESTPTMEGSEELLRVEAHVRIGGSPLDQTVWTDRSGQTRKTQMAAMNLTTYRTDRESAVREEASGFDLGTQTVVRVDGPFEQPHRTHRVVYAVRMKRGEVKGTFAEGATQRVQVLPDGNTHVIVRSISPAMELGDEFPKEAPPGEGEVAANALVQSDNPEIIKLAMSVAPGVQDPWEVATALEKLVGSYVTNKSFAQAMASATDVVRSREGDCTEHAVLLAALLRARQLPSRVAIGLVYSAPVGGFAYHMWTETWIHDRWVPLDATLSLGGIGAAHLKVSQSNLQGVDPFSQFLPVFQLIGNLEIQIVSKE